MTTPLLPVEDHRARVLALLTDGPGAGPGAGAATETVPTAEARGRVLAAAVVATEPLPAFDNSAMDGYAVRAAEVAAAAPEAPVTLPVAGDVPAGAAPGVLAPGTALRIMTGAPVPDGADAIVEVEQTDGGTETVAVRAAREAGSFVRPAGSDLAAGATALAPGATLGAAQIGLLAALGVTEVAVRRRPRVLVVSTGSELAEDPQPGSGQIRDSNGVMLAAAVEGAGAVSVRRLWVADDVPAFLGLLDDELAGGGIDLVLTTGGVSAGAYEVVKEGLGPRGVEFLKVAMQPGMPQGAGRYDGVPVVCLPGNPVSALVSFEAFVRPALRAAGGHAVTLRPTLEARITAAVASIPGKRQLRRGRLDRAAGTVEVWGPPGSGFLGWFAGADCLIDLPPETTGVAAGERVAVWDLSDV
ncbi:gephyrin-like molybdotransferase Glp [Nocardioides sp. YIM 152588]|uniref:molybdopterin molybdotransferase MoeA n=1 Tax=Nocardioides sp. YIM 152588 TaxID=3158259 RepID=UPI0032E3BA7F